MHEPPLHLQAHVEGQQEFQPAGFGAGREHLGSCQESREHGPRGMSGRVPRVIKIHGMSLPETEVRLCWLRERELPADTPEGILPIPLSVLTAPLKTRRFPAFVPHQGLLCFLG